MYMAFFNFLRVLFSFLILFFHYPFGRSGRHSTYIYMFCNSRLIRFTTFCCCLYVFGVQSVVDCFCCFPCLLVFGVGSGFGDLFTKHPWVHMLYELLNLTIVRRGMLLLRVFDRSYRWGSLLIIWTVDCSNVGNFLLVFFCLVYN